MIWDHQHMPESKHSRAYLMVVHLVFGAAMAALFALVFGYFVMLLWNAILPAAAGVHPLIYWQGVGLLVLARILVGSLGCHGRTHGHTHRHRGGAWREYEEWWREVGKESFQEYSGGQHKEG